MKRRGFLKGIAGTFAAFFAAKAATDSEPAKTEITEGAGATWDHQPSFADLFRDASTTAFDSRCEGSYLYSEELSLALRERLSGCEVLK